MNLSDYDELVLAHFLAHEALSVSVDGRFIKRDGFVKIFADQLRFTSRFGVDVDHRCSDIAAVMVDRLIEAKALTTVNDEWTGVSHQFDPVRYRATIKEWIAANALCEQAAAAGTGFWETAFKTRIR